MSAATGPSDKNSKGISLAGEAAIVTGAGRGFGRAIAMGLASAGAAVTITARSKNQLDETVALIERHGGSAGGRAFAVAGDVTNRKDVARVVEAAEKKFGPTSVTVNNAGITGPYGPVWTSDPDDWWDAQ